MPRFFVPRAELGENFLVLTGENAAHARVLRLKNGDAVTVCDGEGEEWHCVVSDVAPGQVSLVVQEHTAAKSEAAVFCSVYVAFAKADKFEHVIQKATELGASELVAFPSARCVSRPDERSLAKKLERWQKIAASAAEQSGRGRIPQVLALPSYEAALHSYLHVGDVLGARLVGLRGATYLDATEAGFPPKLQEQPSVMFGDQPVDRVYYSDAALELQDHVLGRVIRIGKTGSPQTVVWNPGEQGGNAIAHAKTGEWRGFVAVEAAACRDRIVALSPGESYMLSQSIAVMPLG